MKNVFKFNELFESKTNKEVMVVVSGVYFDDKPSLSFINKDLDYFITNGVYISSFAEEGKNEYQLTINCPNINVANKLDLVVSKEGLGEVVEIIEE